MRGLLAALASAAGVLAMVSASAIPRAAGVDRNFTVAMVRTAPPNWPLPIMSKNWTGIVLNISETVDKAVALINKASSRGSDLVLFPELWFPGYPNGGGDWSESKLPMYIENSITFNDTSYKRLAQAAVNNGVYVGFGYSEKDSKHIYMAEALIGPKGHTLIHRHKLRPSGGERNLFTDGTMKELVVVTTPHARIGMLECYEHFWPSMTFPMQAQHENIHLSSFPYLVDDDNPAASWWETTSVNLGTVAHYAVVSGAYVFHTAIGLAAVISPVGEVVAKVAASVDLDATPFLYYSINTSSFNTSQKYDADGQVSWGVLQQIVGGFPAYIPRDNGTFVDFHSIPIELEMSGTYNSSAP